MSKTIEFILKATGGESFVTTMNSAIGVLSTIGSVAMDGAQALKAFAAEADRQGAIMSAFRGNLGQAREATQGLVSDIRMMQAANELAQRGIQASSNDLRNIFVAAVQHADETGQDLDSTITQLTDAIGSGAPRALRQFGVAGRNTNEVLDDLSRAFGETQISADTTADKIDQVTTALENAETAFIDSISNTEELDAAFEDFFSTVSDGSVTFEDAMGAMTDAARSAGDFVVAYLAETVRELTDVARAAQAIADGDFSGAYGIISNDVVDAASNGPAARIQQSMDRRQSARVGEGAGALTAPDQRVITQSPHGGGHGNAEDDPWSDEAIDARMERERDFYNDLGSETDDYYRSLSEQSRDAAEEVEDAITRELDALKSANEEALEAQRRRHEAKMDMLDQEKRKSAEAAADVEETARGVLTPVVNGLTDALTQIVAGTKSADEAFQGLLSSFLEMIAQQSALEAAKEFASAIASFASQDYPGGALHLAAGVAWTAVAVASGAASIAVAPPAASPAAPEQGSSGAGGGGNQTVVVNYNAGVFVSGDRADTGRELDMLIGEGRRRYGSAA